MIAPLKSELCVSQIEPFHQQFLTMLPQIRRQAYIAFRGKRTEAREELTQEVVARSRFPTSDFESRSADVNTGRCGRGLELELGSLGQLWAPFAQKLGRV